MHYMSICCVITSVSRLNFHPFVRSSNVKSPTTIGYEFKERQLHKETKIISDYGLPVCYCFTQNKANNYLI